MSDKNKIADLEKKVDELSKQLNDLMYGKGSLFCGFHLETLIERGLRIGKHFDVQPDCFIDFSHCWLITIGDNVVFAPRVHVIAHDASTLNLLGYTKVGKVTIGNRVFVGNGTIIMPNVTIGDDVIIGAGSVVTKDIASNSIAAGNPAKVIGHTDSYTEKHRELIKTGTVFNTGYTQDNGITHEMKEEMKAKVTNGFGYIGPYF